jgi:ribosome-associated protein
MDREQWLKEITYKATRSSGSGGQHVNKVATKVELYFNIPLSNALTQEEITLLLMNLGSKLTKDGVLILYCDESRSQHRNKQLVTERCEAIILNNLVVKKERKATKPPKKSVQKRLDIKKQTSQKKELRKKPDQEI